MKKTTEQREQELPRFLSFREVRRLTGLSRATVWRLERNGLFPARRRLTTAKVGWLQSEIVAWMEARERIESGEQLKAITPQQEPIETAPQRRRSWLHD